MSAAHRVWTMCPTCQTRITITAVKGETAECACGATRISIGVTRPRLRLIQGGRAA